MLRTLSSSIYLSLKNVYGHHFLLLTVSVKENGFSDHISVDFYIVVKFGVSEPTFSIYHFATIRSGVKDTEVN